MANVFKDMIDFLNTPVDEVLEKPAEALNKPIAGRAEATGDGERERKPGFLKRVADALNTPVQDALDAPAEALNKPLGGGRRRGRAADADTAGPSILRRAAEALNTPVQDVLDAPAEALNRPIGGRRGGSDATAAGHEVEAVDVTRALRQRDAQLRRAVREAPDDDARGRLLEKRRALRALRRRHEHELAAQATAHAETDDWTYTVVPGDTLSGIAQRFYGEAGAWRRIFEANRDRIDNPNLIFPGQTLVMPDDDEA